MIRIITLVVALVVSSPAWAQEVPLQVASLTKVFREGTITTASYAVPADIATLGFRAALLTLDLNTADYEDPATVVTIRIYRLLPSGSWQQTGTATKRGGRYFDVEDQILNPPVQLELAPISAFAGYTVRAEIEVSHRMRVGLSVELIP